MQPAYKILLAFLFCIINQFATAQGLKKAEEFSKTKSRIIKTSPLNILWGSVPFCNEYYLKYESRITPSNTYLIGASFLGRNTFIDAISQPSSGSSSTDLSFLGYRAQGELRHYLTSFNNTFFGISKYDYAPLGFYIGANISYAKLEINSKPIASSNYFEVRHFYITANAGFQFDVVDLFCVDFFIGYGYKNNEWTEYSSRGSKTFVYEALSKRYYNPEKILIGWNIGIPLK